MATVYVVYLGHVSLQNAASGNIANKRIDCRSANCLLRLLQNESHAVAGKPRLNFDPNVSNTINRDGLTLS